ncbi:MAG: hypothetical protein Aurels2KO_55070 [Aureliella sp.]
MAENEIQISEKRIEAREQTHRRAILIDANNQVTPVHILDTSPNGVGLEAYVDPGLRVGHVVKLKVRDHIVRGEVMRLSPKGTGGHIVGLRLSTADGMLLQ